MKTLTERQRKVHDFIRSELEAGNPAPTIREICDQFDIRSTNGARTIVDALIKKGMLRKIPDVARGLTLPPGNPWGAFLETRARMIEHLHQEGQTDEQIAWWVSLDANQVERIRSARAAIAPLDPTPAIIKREASPVDSPVLSEARRIAMGHDLPRRPRGKYAKKPDLTLAQAIQKAMEERGLAPVSA